MKIWGTKDWIKKTDGVEYPTCEKCGLKYVPIEKYGNKCLVCLSKKKNNQGKEIIVKF